jgi:parvulin-like peptidyl-prolyl isomerase
MSESNWIKHLLGLAKLEKNIGKKVAFESSADMIKKLEQELTTLKASIPKIKADAVRELIREEMTIGRLRNDQKRSFIFVSDASKYANKLEAGE